MFFQERRFLSKKRLLFWGLFVFFVFFYSFLAWVSSGGDRWWILDYIDSVSILSGDDAYRFYLAKHPWSYMCMYAYNFILPVNFLLESAVVSIAKGDLLWSRIIHAGLAALSICFTWLAGLNFSVRPWIMTAAALVMGLMPLFAFVSISFYGEIWLILLLSLILWVCSARNGMLLFILVGVLPLIRPEGIFFLVSVFLFLLVRRRWLDMVFLILPGFIYFLYLIIYLDDLVNYVYWRIELRNIFSKIVFRNDFYIFLSTYSLWLLVPALFSGFFLLRGILASLFYGGVLWVVFLQERIFSGQADYEPRYVIVLIPLLVLFWALFFERLASFYLAGRLKNFSAPLCSCVLAGVLIGHFGKLTLIDAAISEKGGAWLFERLLEGEWGRLFPSRLPGYLEDNRRLVEDIYYALDQDKDINRLVVFSSSIFYFLDPSRVPDNVSVDYPALQFMLFYKFFRGQVFVQHECSSMYAYLTVREPTFDSGESRLLYVDTIPMSAYPYRSQYGDFQVYLFSYEKSDSSFFDMSEVLPFDVESLAIPPRASGDQKYESPQVY